MKVHITPPVFKAMLAAVAAISAAITTAGLANTDQVVVPLVAFLAGVVVDVKPKPEVEEE